MKMQNNDLSLEDLLKSLGGELSEEELLLTTLQADIAATITSKRIFSGRSQKDLADELKVSQSLVSKWENGETNFTLRTLVKLALTLGIKMTSPFSAEQPPRPYSSGNVIPFSPPQWRTSCSDSRHWMRSSSRPSSYECKEL